MSSSHEWHHGEATLQEQLGYKRAVSGAHSIFRPYLTAQQQLFHSSLSILPIATLDGKGRPWGSFLVHSGNNDFITSSNIYSLHANVKLHPHHPLLDALAHGAEVTDNGLEFDRPNEDDDDDKDNRHIPSSQNATVKLKLIAGVGVMFENRRRNKLSGFINQQTSTLDTQTGDGSLQIQVTEALGNCPKYINTRLLLPRPEHQPRIVEKQLDLTGSAVQFSDTVLQHIAKVDAVFLSTRYIDPLQPLFKSKLGINIRGGRSGFVRATHEPVNPDDPQSETRPVLYLPDYSGNRFMSSLGNVYTDQVAGLTLPVMEAGTPIHVLYVTGDAQVLMGEQASKAIPGVKTAVQLVVTGYLFVNDAVPLIPTSNMATPDPSRSLNDSESKEFDGIGWSPYNPPIRRLRSELLHNSTTTGDSNARGSDQLLEANLISMERHSEALATFTFQTSKPVRYVAGQHVILDCSGLVNDHVKEYKHMADKIGGERELNDTGNSNLDH